MRMKWHNGTKNPEASGYYLAWNPHEDEFPVVLHFNHEVGGGWWTYHVHRAVVQETVSHILWPMLDDFFESIATEPGVAAQEKTAIKRIARKFRAFLKNKDSDEGFEVANVVDDYVNEGGVCVYDVCRPTYWAQLPWLMDMDDAAVDDVRVGFLTPDSLDIEIEDIKAQVINSVADNVQRALNTELSRLSSPWEPGSGAAPWSRK